ncbi:hypothetical protein NBRC116583_25100 [Arenicella sp. 4NH20-0111]|uniref:ATP-binding protein n=1 Tax=Arenicella sp. 4NH20-0111 TaxID=3127648 RepID=UPI00310C2211
MTLDLETQLKLADSRTKRLKAARDEAERLLEQKSRELYAANSELESIQRGLEDDIKLATHELSVSNQRLQKALDERSTFIGQMSHEVRTPLNAIVGLSEILLTTDLQETQLDYVDTMSSAARALIVLLNDMLDITKIEAGKLEIHLEPVETKRIHQNIISMFKIEAESKGLSLEMNLDSDMPNYIRLDKGRYKQIVNNLVSNALKNTHEGVIKLYVSYRRNAVSEGIGMLSVQVIDTGVGIPEDQLKKIFNAYEQLGSPDKGVGLGLAICSQLCSLMQGSISCESIVGEGSVFEFSLPAEEVNDAIIEPASNGSEVQSESAKISILVAEDNPTNQKVLSAQLAQLGLTAEIVDNGLLAIEKLQSQSYDLVLLDILMPVMDGEETLKTIRQSDDRIAGHYCVALTASSYQDQRNRLLGLGFDGFLSKPLGLTELADALEKVPASRVKIESSSITGEMQTIDIALFDPSYFKAQFGDAWEMVFAEIAPTFLEHSRKHLKQLKAAISDNKVDHINKISHSIKGGAASMGQTSLAEKLAELEANSDSPLAHDWIESIEAEWSEVESQLQIELDRIHQG